MNDSKIKTEFSAVKQKIAGDESGQSANDVATTIIKVAGILMIGVVILSAIAGSMGLEQGDAFYNLSETVKDNITSGYGLAALMVLALGATAIMRYLGFM